VWLGSAAFVPFVLLYYYRLLQNNHSFDALKTAIALAFLLVCGYPSFLIFIAYCMLAALAAKHYFLWRDKQLTQSVIFSFAKNHFLLLLVFAGLCAPALVSYYQCLPLYERGSGATLAKALSNPFPPFSMVSLLTPMAVTKTHEWITTDLAARNSYFGIFTLLFLFIALRGKWNRVQRFTGMATLFTLLFSFGDATPLRKICYYILPLMDSFRHPANMRLFTIIGCLLLAGFALHKFFDERDTVSVKTYRTAAWLLAGAVTALVITAMLHTKLTEKFSELLAALNSGNRREAIKEAMDSFSFSDYASMQGLLQLFFLLVLIGLLRKGKKPKMAALLFITNTLLIAQFSIPFTFVGQSSPKNINAFIAAQPQGYPLPSLTKPVGKCSAGAELEAGDNFGNHSFYNKSLCIDDNMVTPSFLKQYETFLKNGIVRETIAAMPFAYCTDSVMDYFDTASVAAGKKYMFAHQQVKSVVIAESMPASVRVTRFSPGHFSFEVNAAAHTWLNILQNYNSNWKATVNGRAAAVEASNISFMSVQLQKGKSIVDLEYRPRAVQAALWVLLLTALALLTVLIFRKRFTAKRFNTPAA
jgi:Bacterial membrane protein YfhO